jgi:hypothetical protein
VATGCDRLAALSDLSQDPAYVWAEQPPFPRPVPASCQKVSKAARPAILLAAARVIKVGIGGACRATERHLYWVRK